MNVLIASPQLYSAILAKKMQEGKDWNPVYFQTNSSNHDFVKKEFPTAICHNYISAVKGVNPSGINIKKEIVLSTLENIDLDFTIAMSLLDRNDSNSNSFSYKERLSFCYDRLNYWVSIIEQFSIKTILFEEEPHQCSDYILYIVAQHLDIKTILFIRTIADLGIIPSHEFEQPSNKLLQAYAHNIAKLNQKGEIDLDPKLDAYLRKLQGDYTSVLEEHLWDQVDTYQEIFQKGTTYLTIFSKLRKKIQQRLLNFTSANFESDQKEKSRSFSTSNLSYLSFQYYKLKTIVKKKRLYTVYKSMAISPENLTSDYVLCALQYQPEKSTCPLGGKFNDQLLMIKALRESLPNYIKIYVKEHPSQFIYDYARYGEYYRDQAYYASILSIDNVYLIDMRRSIFDLIDHALFVASVTGTICWEAVNRQKSALCFGHSWMAGCEGVHEVLSQDNLTKAIDSILNGNGSINLNHVKLFAKTIFDLGFSSALGGAIQLEHKKITPLANALILEKAIQWLNSNPISDK